MNKLRFLDFLPWRRPRGKYLTAQMHRGIQTIHATSGQCQGMTGKGITVAILDTGIVRHPDFGDRILFFKDFVKQRRQPYDDHGHGTHVAGILAGNGQASHGVIRGVAPECRIVALKVLDRWGNGKLEHVLSGLHWILHNYTKYNIRVVNISVGTIPGRGTDDNSVLIRYVEELWDRGIVVVTAAGNAGPSKGSITSPGISPKVITVGCFDDARVVESSGKKMIHYSGRGPLKDSCIVKPEVVTPGANIISCNNSLKPGAKPYTIRSGTSMSTPMVSGAAALLLQKYPHMTNGKVKLCLKESCDDLGLSHSHQGWGLLNIRRLLKAGAHYQ